MKSAHVASPTSEDQRAAISLVLGTKDPLVRAESAALISAEPDPTESVSRVVRALLHSVSGLVRANALDVLPRLEGAARAACCRILTAVVLEGPPQTSQRALQGILALAEPGDDTTTKAMIAGLFQRRQFDEVEVRVANALAADLRARPWIVIYLSIALSNSDPRLRRRALWIAERLRPLPKEISPALMDRLADPISSIRSRAAVALGRLQSNDPGLTKALTRLALDDPIQAVRAAARGSLSTTDKKSIVLQLAEAALRSREPIGRQQAVEMLAGVPRLGRDIIPPIINRLLNDNDGAVRDAALRGLRGLKGLRTNIIASLSQTLDSESPLTRLRSATALVALGPNQATAATLLELAIEGSNSNDAATARQLLRTMQPPALVVDALSKALFSESSKRRVDCIDILLDLSSLDGAATDRLRDLFLSRRSKVALELVELVRPGLRSNDPRRRQRAVEILGANPGLGRDIVRLLVAQLLEDDDQSVRRAALIVLRRAESGRNDVITLISTALDGRDPIRALRGASALVALESNETAVPVLVNFAINSQDLSLLEGARQSLTLVTPRISAVRALAEVFLRGSKEARSAALKAFAGFSDLEPDSVRLLQNLQAAADHETALSLAALISRFQPPDLRGENYVIRDSVHAAAVAGISIGPMAAYSINVSDDIIIRRLRLETEKEVEDLHEGRYLTFSFLDEDFHRELAADEGLYASRTYQVAVDLSSFKDPYFVSDVDQPMIPIARGSQTLFQVVMLPRSGKLKVLEHSARLEISSRGESIPAVFFVEALETGIGEIDIYVHRDFELLAAATLSACITSFGDRWDEAPPIRWKDQATDQIAFRSKPFRRFSLGAARDRRAACIAVQAASEGSEYLVTVIARNAEFPNRVRLSRDELAANMLRVRGILDRMRRDPLFVDAGYYADGSYVGDFSLPMAWRRDGSTVSPSKLGPRLDQFFRDIALAGASFRGALFPDETGQLALEALKRNTQDTEILQIWLEDRALDFSYPWAWLYDGAFDPAYRDQVNPELFWGYRWVIEQTGDWLEQQARREKRSLSTLRQDVQVRVGFYNFPETAAHQEFLNGWASRSRSKISLECWDDDRSWEQFLPSCTADLIYFFSHGHTPLPLSPTDARLAESIQALRALVEAEVGDPEDASDNVATARKRMLAALDQVEADGLAYEHHIRLTTGTILLNDLRSTKFIDGHSPLVFLNMCESAQMLPSLSTGFVRIFLSKGACGVLGTEIPVPPNFAAFFARLFLDRLAAGDEVGAILLKLRRHFFRARNPLAFAYTYYGDVATRWMLS